MTAVLSTTVRAARQAAIASALDGGSITFFAGTRPAFGSTSGLSPQASAPLSSPAFTLSGTTLTLVGTVEGMRTDAAAITWARFYDSVGAPVMDVDVSSNAIGQTGDIKLSNVSGTVGGFVQLTGGTFTG